MLRFKHKRAGLSLMEALVALFIMAIGMISLLTLFPLGAIQMGRALRDDRCAQCAWQADGVVRTWWQVEVVDKPGTETAPYFASLDGGVAQTATTPGMVVAIDPIGMNSGRSTQPLGGSSIVRKTSSLVTSLKDSIRLCSLTDDVFFNEQATPDKASVASGLVVRQGRYNWMALIQRPVNANRTSANLKILVFDGRAVGTAPANGEVLLTGTTTPSISAAALGSTQVVINMSLTNASFPPIGKGGWILDPGTGNRMDFYRVQSLTDNAAGTACTLELDTPLKNAVTQVVILRGLAEVFDRPMLAPTAYLNPQP